MLINFTFSNHLSFRDEANVSFEATSFRSKTANYRKIKNQKILNSIAIYGSNASGKSNVIDALQFAVNFITNSSSSKPTNRIKTKPYLLNSISDELPSKFIFEFLFKTKTYRYSFSVNKVEVLYENLEQYNDEDELYFDLFLRENKKIILTEKSLDKDIVDKTRINVLFLSALAQWNDKLALDIVNWFDSISFIDNNNIDRMLPSIGAVVDLLSDQLLESVQAADFGIESIAIGDSTVIDLPEDMPKQLRDLILSGDIEQVPDYKTTHTKYNDKNEKIGTVEFSLLKNESDGTKKFISILPLLLYTLTKGGVLVVDELENYLHPLLVKYIIEFFHNKNLNKRAQLLMTTHDVHLLDADVFRSDQLYIASKDKFGSSELYSFTDFEDIEQIKKKELSLYYLSGKFGGVPMLNKHGFMKV